MMLGDKWHSDTVLLSLLSTLNLHHSSVLHDFITWCEGACLQLNSTKTKEVIVTFSSKQRQLGRGHHYLHLGGTCRGGGGIQVLGHNFWQPSEVFHEHWGDPEKVPPETISAQEARTRLLSITKVCSEIVGHLVRALSAFCDQQTIRTAHRILHDPSHTLPSGRWLRCPRCRTQRRRATFVPAAVQLLNSDSSLSQHHWLSTDWMHTAVYHNALWLWRSLKILTIALYVIWCWYSVGPFFLMPFQLPLGDK